MSPERRRLPLLLAKPALVLLSVLSLLALLELGARLLPSPEGFHQRVRAFSAAACERDDTLGHRLRPGVQVEVAGVRYAISSLGLRSPELRGDAPGPRILLLGDSVTMGWGVAEEGSYARALERRLRDDGASVEVINAGVLAYGSPQEAAWLEEIGPRVAPDLLLVGYFPNDPEGWEAATRLPGPRWSRLWQLLAPRMLALGVRLGWTPSATEHYRALHAPDSQSWRDTRQALARIGAWAQAREIPAGLLLLPDLSLLPYPLGDVHARLSEEGRALGFHVLDLAPTVAGLAPRSPWVAPDDSHPDAATHERYAAAITEWLLHEDLLLGRGR